MIAEEDVLPEFFGEFNNTNQEDLLSFTKGRSIFFL